MKKDILLFGIQGSGKGTQADLLLKKLENYKYFEPGNIFRALKSNDNIIGEHIRERMDKGEMLNDETTFGIFDIYFHLIKQNENMLIDGFLRTLNQMYFFLYKMHMQNDRDYICIYYHLEKDEAIKRLLARAEKEGRKDDNLDGIKKRLEIYEKETLPVIKYLDNIGKLITINANNTIEGIFQETCEKLSI